MTINVIVRRISIAALFLIPLFPLVVAPSLVVPFVTSQAFYFRILVEIAFAGWFVLALLDAKYRPRLTPLTIAVSIFTVVALIADLCGVNPLKSLWSNFDRMEGWITIIHLWALYMVMTSFLGSGHDGKNLWNKWLNCSLAVSAIVAIYGLFQLFGWAQTHYDGLRIDASFGNPTFLAAYLLFHFFIAIYLLSTIWEKKERRSAFLLWAYSILALFLAFDIFNTGTRGTFLGLVIGLMASLVLFAIFHKSISKKWRLISVGIVGVIMIIGVVFWLNRDSGFIKDHPLLERFASISLSDASDQSRLYVWPLALKGIAEKPILGWGQENFNLVFQKNYNPAINDQEPWFDRAHDVFLDQLVSSGIIGFLSYIAIYILFLITIWRSALPISQKCLLTGLLAGYCVHNIFVFDCLASYIFFYAMLAFADSLNERKTAPWLENKILGETAAKYVVLPVATLALAVSIYFFNMRPLSANIYLSEAHDTCSKSDADTALFSKALSANFYMSSEDVLVELIPCAENVISNPLASGSVKQSFINLTIAQIKIQVADTPDDAYIYYISGPFLKQIGQFAQAESLLVKGHELMPGQRVISFELASLYLFEGKAVQAADILRPSYNSDPGSNKTASAYAVTLMIAGREDQARQVLGVDPGLLATVKADVDSRQLSQATGIFQSIIAQPESISAIIQQAQIQYAAGNTEEAIEMFRSIEISRPQDKDQIEAAIKAVQP